MLVISKAYYNFKFENDFTKLFLIQLFFLSTCFITVKLVDNNLKYLLSIPLLLVSIYYTFIELDRRIDIKTLLYKFVKRIDK